jgi:serine/threonine protein kinase
LGRGGFGDVWKAVGPGGTFVALKIMNLADNKLAIREFRALSQVKNIKQANLVSIHGIWLKDRSGKISTSTESNDPDSAWLKAHGSELIIVMDLGEESLACRLEKCKQAGLPGIPNAELFEYMADAARGIDYLNQASSDSGAGHSAIQHCDIKPHNLLIVGGCIKICDFGLARAADVHARATSAGITTIAYSPPEYLVRYVASRSSDQYSLAVTYYELSTGSLPFREGIGHYELISAVAEGKLDFSRISSTAEQAVLRRATSLDPNDRYGSCREMINELRRAVDGSPTAAPKSPAQVEAPFVCPPQPNRGDEIVPHYHLVERIGAGGFGDVWRANGPGDIPAAIKIIADLEGLGGRELQALELIKNLRHVHLLELHGYWLIDDNGRIIPKEARTQANAPVAKRLVIATQLADKNLRQRLDECRRANGKGSGIDPKELLRYMHQAAEAIDYLNNPRRRSSADPSLPTVESKNAGQKSGSAEEVAPAAAGAAAKDITSASSDQSLYATLRPETARMDDGPERHQDQNAPISLVSEWLLPLEPREETEHLAMKPDGDVHYSIQHRDIKPENILLIGNDIKVADFGLAKLLEGASAAVHRRSAPLTLAYAAPELFERKVTQWSDQYSLAITYYHLRTGKLPFSDESPQHVIDSHKQGTLDLFGLAEDERRVIRRATALVPGQRFETCTEMVSELERAIHPRGGQSDVVGTPTTNQSRRPEDEKLTAVDAQGSKQRRRWDIVLASLAVVGTLVLLFVMKDSFDTTPSPPKGESVPSPATWQPAGSEPAEDAAMKTVGKDKLYDKVIINKDDVSILFLLIAKTAEGDPATFYMTKDKVSNEFFETAARDSDFQKLLNKAAKSHPWSVQGKWKEEMPWVSDPHWKSFPVLNVTVMEAHCFASWLGGKLPTRLQWDKAGGRYERSQRARHPWPTEAGPGEVAINRPGPMMVDEASKDVSVTGCHDMAGNGFEWTRDIFEDGSVGADNPDPARLIYLRGMSFTEKEPFSFSKLEQDKPQEYAKKYDACTPRIGFRVVLEQPTNPR